MSELAMALRMLLRDLRAGELRLLALAMIVAVASLTSVSFFTDRVRQALTREANQLLGGDLLLVADHAWRGEILDEARRLGLTVLTSTTFTSMASSGASAQLAGVKAVEPGYPLRGVLRTAPGLNRADAEVRSVPAPGHAWLDERLTSALGVKPGDDVGLGNIRLRVDAVLTFESDRGANFFSIVPRLMMNAADVAATGLIQVGSRVSYRLHVAGEPAQVDAFRGWVKPRLQRGESLEDISNARPEVRNALDRAQRFLRLASLLAVVLAAVAVGLGARRFMQRHLDGCAVMRCLGAGQAQLTRLYFSEFLIFGAIASALGAVLGYAIQLGLEALVGDLIAGTLPPPSALPLAYGFAVGLTLLAGFIAPQLLRLANVPTLRVMRREFGSLEPMTLAAWAAGALALLLLMFWIAEEALLGAWVAGGFAGAFIVFALVSWGLLGVLGRLRGGEGAAATGWRYGLASLRRRRASSVTQAVALGLGITAILLLTITRGDLLDNWRQSAPPDAPNRFVINIQPDQVAPLRAFFAGQGVSAPDIVPMVRGRLTSVNGRPVGPEHYEEGRAQRLVEREFNLSYMTDLPEGNRVVAGRWFAADAKADFSVEIGLAQTLGLALGDTVVFTVAGAPVEARVTSLRRLDWDSMRVNFFVIAPPAVLADYPASFITAFHLPVERTAFVGEMVAQFPNVTVIDVAAIMRQLQAVLDRLAQAVQFIFLFALAAGLLVLFAALESTHDERAYEVAVMRTLGARSPQLRSALMAEFAVLGAIAGMVAGVAATAIGWALAHFVFKLPYTPGWEALALGLAGGVIGTTLAGLLGTARTLRLPALQSLRALG
jgi:putative ABC transport system permease protein